MPKTQTPASRQTLTAKPVVVPSRDELFPLDCQDLMGKAQFRRFMLTVFEAAGMFSAASSSKTEPLQMLEGRRGLGYDMLRNLEQHSGHDALLRILAEREPPKEATHGRRNHDHERQRELDDGDVDDNAERGQFLNYDPA